MVAETERPPAKVRKQSKRLEKDRSAERLEMLRKLESKDTTNALRIAYLAYREKPMSAQLIPTPTTAAEWTRLRRWAKRVVERHATTIGRDSPYTEVTHLPTDDVAILVQYADTPPDTRGAWPSDLLPPPENDIMWQQLYIALLQAPATPTML